LSWGGQGLRVRRRGRLVLDVAVAFEPGAVTAVLGPNGSGKTTLLTVLAGLLDAESAVDGTEGWHEADWARQVASVFPGVPDLPFCVEEVLLSSRFPDGSRWVDPSHESRAELEALLGRLEVFTDVRAGLGRAYAELSEGERQLVDVARGVLQRTPVLLLDEPTSSLDLRHRLLVLQLLRDEAARGRTVGVSLHDLREASSADRVVVLSRGILEASGPPAVLTPELLARVWGVVPLSQGYGLL
jgi:ABC-type cobalamin/Fe3+-siderophores transport system ATPase subunit